MISVVGETIREEEATFEGPEGKLSGTLAVPIDARPRGSVLILPGSGRADRDGNVKRLPMGIYRDLAQAVSGQGFVTLRYDKRGVGRSEGKISQTGFWDLVDDAQAAVEFLRRRQGDGGGPIILLGHSEGCIIAPAVNSRSPVDGLILLAGPCESLAETLPRQQELGVEALRAMGGAIGLLLRMLHVPERQSRKSKALMERIMTSDRPEIRVSAIKINAKWIREHCEHDVARDLPGVRCPLLAITGGNDVQVLPEHARKIAESVAGPAEWHIIPKMTHIFRRTDESVNILKLLKLYKKQCREPVDTELLAILGTWLDAQFPSRSQSLSSRQ